MDCSLQQVLGKRHNLKKENLKLAIFRGGKHHEGGSVLPAPFFLKYFFIEKSVLIDS